MSGAAEKHVPRLFVGGPRSGEVRWINRHISSVQVVCIKADMMKIRYPSPPELIGDDYVTYRLTSAKFAFGEIDAMICETVSKEAANDLMRKLASGIERFLIDSAVDILEASNERVQN